MIGIAALFFPLILGAVLAYPLGIRGRKLGESANKGKRSKRLLFLQAIGGTLVVIAAASLFLTLLFAGPGDHLTGEVSLVQRIDYAKLQAVLLSLLTVPATIIGFKDGRDSV